MIFTTGPAVEGVAGASEFNAGEFFSCPVCALLYGDTNGPWLAHFDIRVIVVVFYGSLLCLVGLCH